jgi:dGTPase
MVRPHTVTQFETSFLAPYAMKSCDSKGREYKEKEHSYRSAYQRDRDRIIHSTAFRRLEYKTQVFVNHEGDDYRTRLTHSVEVAQIARTIAFALRLNIDLTEAVALAHDLGHTPFGHAGEDTLNDLMSEHGGFNHNLHGLRVVTLLEERYPDFPGLNLTWEVREGIIKHSTAFDKAGNLDVYLPQERPTLETQIVDIADEIAYDNHDIDDGLSSGLLKLKDLERLDIWRMAHAKIKSLHPGPLSDAYRIPWTIRILIDVQVTDLIGEITQTLKTLRPKNAVDIKRHPEKIVRFSPDMARMKHQLKEVLMEKLYRHYRVVRMSNKASRFIRQLFDAYTDSPGALPEQVQKRIESDGVHQAVCDYIAGMTDRYALNEYKKLFDPYEKV